MTKPKPNLTPKLLHMSLCFYSNIIYAIPLLVTIGTDGQLQHQFDTISQQQHGAQVSNGPQKQATSLVSSNSNNMPQAKPMTSKELWLAYWKKYREFYDMRRNNIPVYPGLQTSETFFYCFFLQPHCDFIRAKAKSLMEGDPERVSSIPFSYSYFAGSADQFLEI